MWSWAWSPMKRRILQTKQRDPVEAMQTRELPRRATVGLALVLVDCKVGSSQDGWGIPHVHAAGCAGPDGRFGTGGYRMPVSWVREDKTVALPQRVPKAVKIKPCPVHRYFVETLALGTFPSLFLTLACREVPGFKKYCLFCDQGHGALLFHLSR